MGKAKLCNCFMLGSFYDGASPRPVIKGLTCVGKHSDNHVGARWELIHVVFVISLCASYWGLRRMDPVQFAVCTLW